MSVNTVKMNASPGFVTELLAALQQLSGPCGLEWIDDTLDILQMREFPYVLDVHNRTRDCRREQVPLVSR